MRKLMKGGMVKMLLAVIAGAVFSGQVMGIVGKIPGVGGMLANLGGDPVTPEEEEGG